MERRKSARVKLRSDLNLGERNLEAEALVEIRVQCVLLDGCFLFLQTFAVVLQNDFHERV